MEIVVTGVVVVVVAEVVVVAVDVEVDVVRLVEDEVTAFVVLVFPQPAAIAVSTKNTPANA